MGIGLEADWKTYAAIGAVIIGNASFLPYLIGILKRETQPHAYTWLIWAITQGTAAAGLFYGGGGLVSYGLLLSSVLVFLIFLLSLKYGTKNIRKSDAIVLIAALAAIMVWWQLDNPVLAVVMVSAIDGIGYVPTYRKLLQQPWSENITSWVGFLVSYLLALASLLEYNALTVTYLITIFIASALLVVLALVGRMRIPKPV